MALILSQPQCIKCKFTYIISWFISCNHHTIHPTKYAYETRSVVFCLIWCCDLIKIVFIHIFRGYFAGTLPIMRLLNCQWNYPNRFEYVYFYMSHETEKAANMTQQNQANNHLHISWDILHLACESLLICHKDYINILSLLVRHSLHLRSENWQCHATKRIWDAVTAVMIIWHLDPSSAFTRPDLVDSVPADVQFPSRR